MYSLVCANFSSLKKLLKKIENHKKLSQTKYNNIASKIFNYHKKSNPLVQIIIASHLACVAISQNVSDVMRLPSQLQTFFMNSPKDVKIFL